MNQVTCTHKWKSIGLDGKVMCIICTHIFQVIKNEQDGIICLTKRLDTSKLDLHTEKEPNG